ncbi:MAG: sarcosine oxidase subunit alpha family protein [Geminicoccaceae bacterium]
MSGPLRLAEGGTRLDRSRPIGFTLDGKRFTGFAGDTLASALLASGVRLLGRSFKRHRPRGLLAAGPEEPNVLLRVERGPGRVDPNSRATLVELVPGLAASTQNAWPSVRFDAGAIFDRFAGHLAAGFYYKTFFRPGWAWHRLFEPAIRRAAGLGRAPETADPDRYLHRHVHCDLLIVGGGPTGLRAARRAARAGARVILADERPAPGGGLADTGTAGPRIAGAPAAAWLAGLVAELDRAGEVVRLERTTAQALHPSGYALLLERVSDHLREPDPRLPRERLWKVRPRAVLLATGAIERPLLFPDNDRPGILLAGAARAFLARQAVLPGRDLVVAAFDDSAYAAALELARAGGRVHAIVDPRPEPGWAARTAAEAGLRVLAGWAPVGSEGGPGLRAVRLAPLDAKGRPEARGERTIPCDALLVSGGWTPAVQLWAQAGGAVAWDEAAAAFLPTRGPSWLAVAGAAAGARTLGEALAQADRAVDRLLAGLGFTPEAEPLPPIEEPEPARALPPWATPELWRRDPKATFVDFQNDVSVADLEGAVREGFSAPEHAKRWTTAGMATDQGKTAQPTALALLAASSVRPLEELAPTTMRPPWTPTSFGALAGVHRSDLFRPIRTTPLHGWAAAKGAIFEDVGHWKRPTAFPRPGESLEAAVARECRAVRTGVGLLDASTLGAFDVQGEDAASFLERIWTIDVADLPVGRCRYGLVLKDDGTVLDDGVVCRLAPNRFLLSTTTGGAARLHAWLERWAQTEWPELEVWITPVTEGRAVIAVQGPQSRLLLRRAVSGVDLSAKAFPHMAWREGWIGGVPVRIFRVSFTGELGFELHVPASRAEEVVETLERLAPDLEPTPYGIEAMHLLRLEKGYILVGHETDGTITPRDLGLERLLSSKKDFVGKRSLELPEHRSADRPRLVGLLPVDPTALPSVGGQLVERAEPGTPSLGRVSSAGRSPTLGRTIALGLVRADRARPGTRLLVYAADRPAIEVELCSPCFLDPEGARLRG